MNDTLKSEYHTLGKCGTAHCTVCGGIMMRGLCVGKCAQSPLYYPMSIKEKHPLFIILVVNRICGGLCREVYVLFIFGV